MFKLVFLLVGAVVSLGGLAVGGISAAFAGGVLKVPEVSEIRNAWGTVDQERTEVLTSIVLNNPNAISLGLNNVSIAADVYMNDVRIAQGRTDGVQLPEGLSTMELVTRIENARIADWWPTHIAGGESTTVRIVPRGEASILNWSFDVPGPGITQSFQTDLLQAAASDEPQSFDWGLGFGATIKSREFRWGEVTAEATHIDGTVVVHNSSPLPIPISEIAFEFVMNGVVVGQGTTRDPAVLMPGQDTPVPLHLFITNAKLIEWWPTHIEAGERTRYRIDLDAVFRVPVPLMGEQPIPVRLMRHEDEFRTQVLGG